MAAGVDVLVQIARVESHVLPDLDEGDAALADEASNEVVADREVFGGAFGIQQRYGDLVHEVAFPHTDTRNARRKTNRRGPQAGVISLDCLKFPLLSRES